MKKLFSFAVFALCIAFSVASQAQSIILIADNVQGSSQLGKGAIDVLSMGTSLSCAGCSITPTQTGAGTGKGVPGKIVFNMQNDPSVNTLKTALLAGSLRSTGNGDAYFVFCQTGQHR